MGGGGTSMDFGQFCDRLRIISMTRCDNVASLLSPSTKYAFAGYDTEIDNDFGGGEESVNMNNSELLRAVSMEDTVNKEIDFEAMKYLAGYITFKVSDPHTNINENNSFNNKLALNTIKLNAFMSLN